jgi:hypothetical protein
MFKLNDRILEGVYRDPTLATANCQTANGAGTKTAVDRLYPAEIQQEIDGGATAHHGRWAYPLAYLSVVSVLAIRFLT